MELVGDADGIAALKAMHTKDKGYLKFLVTEAQSNIDQTARFASPDGKKWRLKYDGAAKTLEVSPEPAAG